MRKSIKLSNLPKALLCGAALMGTVGASGRTIPAPNAEPNYTAKLEHRVSWKAFPLNVYFKRNVEYTPERASLAESGFRQWESASRGVVQVAVVQRHDHADVVVEFDPRSADGATTNTFSRGVMVRADMKIGVRRGTAFDVACIAAHEFGHALGITGHSDDRGDLMYPYRWMGKGCGISRRDLNTLSSRYPAVITARELTASP